MSLTRIVLQSLKWSVLGEVASRIVGPLVFLVLARILVPDDFGVVAAATVVVSFSQVFWDAGLAKALIQRQEQVAEASDVVFWINLALGGVLLLGLLATADIIASFFHDPRIAPVLRVLGFQLPLAALAAVHAALFQKDFQFKKLFWIRLIATSFPAMAALPLAMHGAGYWALVAGTLAGQAANTMALWWFSPWRPKFRFNRSLALDLWRFGYWAMLSGLLGWFFLWMDAIIVGHYLDTHSMGVYRVGNTFVAMAMSLIAGPILPVAYSMFSRTQHDPEKTRRAILLGGKAVAVLILPLGFGLFLTGDLVATIIFGNHWPRIGDVIGWLAITQAIAYTVSVKQEAYRAIGRPDVETKIMLVSMAIRLPFYLVSIQFGLMAFIIARLMSTLLGVVNHLVFATRFLGIGFGDYARLVGLPLAASLAMVLFGRTGLTPLLGEFSPILQTLITVLTCAALYTSLIFVFERSFLVQGRDLLRRSRTGVLS